MKNYIQHGDTVDLTAPAGGVVAGTAYVIGAAFVLAVTSADAGRPFAARFTGVVSLPKAAGVAWGQGALLYWDGATRRATTTVTPVKIGIATATAAAADPTAAVRLNGSF